MQWCLPAPVSDKMTGQSAINAQNNTKSSYSQINTHTHKALPVTYAI